MLMLKPHLRTFLAILMASLVFVGLAGCNKPKKSEAESAPDREELVLAGSVLTSAGQPASGVRIFADSSSDALGLTDQNGHYSLRLTPADLAGFSPAATGRVDSFVLWFESQDQPAHKAISQPLRITDRGSITMAPVTLNIPATFNGNVMQVLPGQIAAQPAAEAGIRIGRQETRTDTAGNFTVDGIPPGLHPVVVRSGPLAASLQNEEFAAGADRTAPAPIVMFDDTSVSGTLFELPHDPAAADIPGHPYLRTFTISASAAARFVRYSHNELTEPFPAWKEITSSFEYDFPDDGPHTLSFQFANHDQSIISESRFVKVAVDRFPGLVTFTIGDGSGQVHRREVILSINVPQSAWRMRLSESIEDIETKVWVVPQKLYPYTFALQRASGLIEGIGTRTLHLQFSDPDGNLSPVYKSSVLVDLFPRTSQPAFTINGGEALTRERLVRLEINVPVNAHEMRVYEIGGESGGNMGIQGGGGGSRNTANTWIAAQPVLYFMLGGDGLKTIYLQFRSRDLIASPTHQQEIRVQAFADYPVNSGIILADGAPQSVSRHIDVRLLPPPASTAFRLSESPTMLQAMPWQTLVSRTVYSVGDAGLKTIYAQFRNIDGEESQVFQATIYVDPYPPESGSFLINGGAPVASIPLLTLNILPPPNTVAMMVSEGSPPDERFHQWLDVAPVTSLQVHGTGSKIIYLRFRAFDGAVSSVIQRQIFYDPFPFGTAGLAINSNAPSTSSGTVTLSIYGLTNLLGMRVANSIQELQSLPFSEYRSTMSHNLDSGDGVHKVYIQFRTAAGEISPVYFDEIERITPPTP